MPQRQQSPGCVAALWMMTSLLACSSTPGGPDASVSLDEGQDSGVDAGPSNFYPEQVTAQGLGDFLSRDPHRQTGWRSDVDMPRPPGTASPHGHVRVFFNPALQTSIAAGNGAFDGGTRVGGPHDQGSVAVKEMYDLSDPDAGAPIVARAMMVKTAEGDGEDAWTYYCVGPASRCAGVEGTEAQPVFGTGAMVINCHGCHFGNIFTEMP